MKQFSKSVLEWENTAQIRCLIQGLALARQIIKQKLLKKTKSRKGMKKNHCFNSIAH